MIAFDEVSANLEAIIRSLSKRYNWNQRINSLNALQFNFLFFIRHPREVGQFCMAYESLRRLQVFVTYLNLVHRNIIFTWKLFCIGTCIVTGYAAIAHFADYPIFGIMYYIFFFEVLLIYTLLYEKGFKLAALFEKAKGILVLQSRKVVGGDDWKLLKRQVRSIPEVGIKVGEFHMLERNSTPAFLYYVLANIVNMLVVCR